MGTSRRVYGVKTAKPPSENRESFTAGRMELHSRVDDLNKRVVIGACKRRQSEL